MKAFLDVLNELSEFREAADICRRQGTALNMVGISETQKAHIIAALIKKTGKQAAVISGSELSARRLFDDLEVFLEEETVLLPVSEPVPRKIEAASFGIEAQRIAALEGIEKGKSAVMSAAALLCFVMPKNNFAKNTITLALSTECTNISEKLVRSGYKRTPVVTDEGQFCIRGGIVDVYPPSAGPYRIEFFGDEVDSIRIFDADSQLSIENRDEAVIIPVGSDSQGSIIDYFDENTIFVFDEPLQVSEGARSFEKRIEEMTADMILHEDSDIESALILSYDKVLSEMRKGIFLGMSALSLKSPDYTPERVLNITAKSIPSYAGKIDLLCEDVKHWNDSGCQIFILASGSTRAKGIEDALQEYGIRCEIKDANHPPNKGVCGIYTETLSRGFEYPHIKTVFVSGADIFQKKRRTKRVSRDAGKAIRSFDELTPGDYVVHQSHGIGRFETLCTITVEGIPRDYLKIGYKNSDVLYVPVNQLNLIHRYSYAGDDAPAPKVNKLGGAEWGRAKASARASVKQLAIKLIDIYAERNRMIGHAFSEDTTWQKEFEESFPYEETPEQLSSIEEMKRDMESKKPMDRLLCGDVGYGKTEVAIRGAFKCVNEGLQCAYLVPTTILAAQHYNLFVDRMKNFPVKIEMLSRFRTPAEQKKILKGLASGEIDIVIGTHRLLGDDVKFRRLGLLIVDEEQRFGVGHKEKIKNLKRGIDVLTLTATPIPRTLNMAMTGIRDMSVITQPPKERLPIQTYVLEHDNTVIKDAIEKELARGGQVYYVYNRISGIYNVAKRLGDMLPDARITVAHGRMNETVLENEMMTMIEGKTDILVCTTIIETGIDIPNVNTLIVENADRMGLSQLYQLRGRVGR